MTDPILQPALVSLLGQTDALFQPIRRWPQIGRAGNVAAILEARETHQKIGLPIPVTHGATATERKRRERLHDRLEAAGGIVFHRSGGRRDAWRLGDDADWRLRRACTWSDWPEAVAMLQAVAAHTATGHHNSGHVPERTLAGIPDGTDAELVRDRLVRLEEIAAPALARGWLEAWSDCNGVVGYLITDAGLAVLHNLTPPAGDWPGYSSELADVYLEALGSHVAALRAARPKRDNDAPIPLSAGEWPEEDTRAAIKPLFLRNGRVRKPRAGKVRPNDRRGDYVAQPENGVGSCENAAAGRGKPAASLSGGPEEAPQR